MGETDIVDEASAGRPDPGPRPRRGRRRVVTVAIALGTAAGVAVGATALAAAATSPTTTRPGSTSTTSPAKVPGAFPGRGHLRGGFGPGGFGGVGGGFGGGFLGPVVHGQYTVQGPNGYETIDERTGTVSAVTDTSGSTWSLSVKSTDGTSATFTVDSTTSVNGGESGIASVKTGDTVDVTATVSGGTSTATRITDQTTLQTDGKAWMPMRLPTPPDATTAPAAPDAAPTSTT